MMQTPDDNENPLLTEAKEAIARAEPFVAELQKLRAMMDNGVSPDDPAVAALVTKIQLMGVAEGARQAARKQLN